MNPESIEKLISQRQEKLKADAIAESERKAKFLETARLEQSLIPRITALFDALKVERVEHSRWHTFDLDDTQDPRIKVQTSVSISYKYIQEVGPTERGLFGFDKPGKIELVPTDEIDKIIIFTSQGAKVIEKQDIQPYDTESKDVSERDLERHFRHATNMGTPTSGYTDPEATLVHINNVAETVDLITNLYAPELAVTLQPGSDT